MAFCLTASRGRKAVSSFLVLFLFVAVAESATMAPAYAADGTKSFVTRDGAKFELAGNEFKFVGFNLFDAAATDQYKCAWWSRYSDAELDSAMKYMHDEAGATVLRFWAYQTYTASGTDYSGTDKVINLAKKNGLKVLPVLEDGPGYCTTGSAGQAKWQNGDQWYVSGYKQPYGSAALSYRDYVQRIVAHYKDEPVIFGWMLMNEADTSARNASGQSALVDFATDMGNVVKNVDNNHLLTVGTQSNGASGATGSDFAAVYGVPTIDFTEAHDWSVYGWGDQNSALPGLVNGALPDPSSAACQPQYKSDIACALANSKKLNKPFIIGESGIAANDDASRASRAARMDARLAAAFDNGASGYLMWQFNKVLDTEQFDVLQSTNDPLIPVMKKYSKSFAKLPGAVAEPVVADPPALSSTTPVAGTIGRSGTQLTLGGKPYTFTGVNAYQLATNWSVNYGCGNQVNSANALFSTLRPNSVVRFWAYQDLATNKVTGQRDWTSIDAVVAAAEANHQRLLVTLADQWSNCHGEAFKDPAWYAGGYKSVQNGASQSYYDYMQAVVDRYKFSPAIGMWELVNEPEAGPGGAPTLRAFFDDAGAKLKSIDSSHLLEMGVIGGNQWSLAGGDYATVGASPAIDVLTYHDYNDSKAMPDFLAQRVLQMKTLNKPIIIGESGISDCGSSNRTKKLESKMKAAYAAGVSGYIPWNWEEKSDCGYDISPSDSIMKLLHDFELPCDATLEPGTPVDSTPVVTVPATPEPATTTPVADVPVTDAPVMDVPVVTVPVVSTPPSTVPVPQAPVTPPVVSVNTTTVDDSNTSINYQGWWNTSSGAGKYNNGDHYSDSTGATITIPFNGTSIAVVGAKAPWHGIGQVSVDGGAIVNVDFYSANRADQATVFTRNALNAGNHTLTLKVSGQRSAASSGTVVTLDAVIISGGSVASVPTTTPANPTNTVLNDNAFAYQGSWSTGDGSAKYKNDDHYSDSFGATATISFNGTGVTLFGATAAWHGEAAVSIDGGPVTIINAYSANRADGVALYSKSGLVSGSHIVTVKVLGAHAPNSGGNVIALDKAVVVS